MIRSMTGFGRASFQLEALVFDIEVRSVNHRHLDARVRTPKLLASLEPDVRARVQARLSRGKVDLSIVQPDGGASASKLEIDTAAAREYARTARDLAEMEGISGELDVATLLTLPGVARFVEPELSPDASRDPLLVAVDEALDALEAMRVAEGAALERDLNARLETVAALAESLAGRSEEVREAARARLRKRCETLKQETGFIDEARLHQEIVFAADRLDVTEEIVRLRSHIDQFRSTMDSGEAGKPVGRRLDFLLQELGRETNTIGSKGSDAPIAHQVVELKTELERLREQVQNVE